MSTLLLCSQADNQLYIKKRLGVVLLGRELQFTNSSGRVFLFVMQAYSRFLEYMILKIVYIIQERHDFLSRHISM